MGVVGSQWNWRISFPEIPHAWLSTAIVVLLVGIACSPGRASAQELRGEVVDAVTGEGIAGALVSVTDSTASFVRRALTSDDGGFVLIGVPAGAFDVSVEAFGFETAERKRVVLDRGPVFLSIAVTPAPIGTEGITVSIERRRPHLQVHGFYDRLERGHGRFVTEDQLSKLTVLRSHEVFRRVAGVQVVAGEPILTRGGSGFRHQGLTCAPNVWIDGRPARLETKIEPSSPRAFDNLLPSPEDIRAIEVYSGGAGTPAQWGGSSSACGVIVVWLKH